MDTLKKQTEFIKKEIAELTIILEGSLTYNDLMSMTTADINIFMEAFSEIQKKKQPK